MRYQNCVAAHTSDILRRYEPSQTSSVIPGPIIDIQVGDETQQRQMDWMSKKICFLLITPGPAPRCAPPPEQFILTQQKQSHASNQLNFKPYCFILFAAISTLKFISCIPCRAGANNYLRHEIMLIHGLKTRAFFT